MRAASTIVLRSDEAPPSAWRLRPAGHAHPGHGDRQRAPQPGAAARDPTDSGLPEKVGKGAGSEAADSEPLRPTGVQSKRLTSRTLLRHCVGSDTESYAGQHDAEREMQDVVGGIDRQLACGEGGCPKSEGGDEQGR